MACKRIDILGSCSGESLLALLDKLLNSIEHIRVNDTGMCPFGVEAIFLSTVDMLVEWDRCFTVLAPGAHSQFGSGKNTQFEPEQRANPFENVFSKTAVFPPPAIAETDL